MFPPVHIPRQLARSHMRDPVSISIPGERVPDGRGGTVVSPGTTVETRGYMRPMNSDEKALAGRMSETVEGVLVLDVDLDIKSSYTLVWDGDTYNIKGVSVGSRAHMAFREVMVARAG